jgi:hypothetical protein
MSNFKKVFGDSNIISLDGTISRGRANPNSFSLNTKPIVFKSKADIVRESSVDNIVLPSTKGVTKQISKPPLSQFKTKTIPTFETSPPIVEKITSKPVVVIDRETKQLSQISPIQFRQEGEIELVGDFPQNKIKFDRYSFGDIISVNSVTFQFILRLITNDGERYFTSDDFKNKLQNDYLNNLPYRALKALNPASVVTVDLRNALDSIGGEYNRAEIEDGVVVKYNTFVDITGEVDFTKIVEYVDWVVSKPPTEYDDRIIPASTLGNWEVVGGMEVGGQTIPKTGGTAVPTKDQLSETLIVAESPIMTQVPPVKKLPVILSDTISKSDKPAPKPKPIGNSIVELPIIEPIPNRFSGFSSSQQNAVQRNFVSIIGGSNLVPEIPVSEPTIRNILGVGLDGISSPQIRKPRNLL